MKTTRCLLIGAAIALMAPGLGVAATAAQDPLTFAVSLDDRPIGVHRFRIVDDGATRVVESAASFDVRILRIPVYRYRHRNTETWQNGCLKRIDSETDANGTPYAVNLSRTAAGYTIATPTEARSYEADCLMSFAYWDQRFLRQKQLLNTQTGELVAVEIQALGESLREIANRTLSVEGFRILAESRNIDITVFYDSRDGRWVALESVLENGRVLRYVAAADDRLAAVERGSDPLLTRR
ncbi:MAG: DUF6134 family protein [Candidatus Competibacteraceae bacterium]|nr:DUF6134 family protein [Candidatus Competibacteraceae bacterium]